MKQTTHTWLAVRALALLEDTDKSTAGLVRLLKPHVRTTAIGAWLPDLAASKKGFGDVDNHTLKMEQYTGSQAERFTLKKAELLKRLGEERSFYDFINCDSTLTASDNWWDKPYKAEPQPGQHLANSCMALSETIVDLLILGDRGVARIVPGEIDFAAQLNPKARSTQELLATYFFMLSHFIADSCQPSHCDARKLSAYGNGLHKELEGHWDKKVGNDFKKTKLLNSNADPDAILRKAKQVDASIGLTFSGTIPTLRKVGGKKHDVWLEMIMVCRGSFAISCIMVPVKDYPLETRRKAPFKKLFAGEEGALSLKELDKVILHDAVLNIAIVWKHIWQVFK